MALTCRIRPSASCRAQPGDDDDVEVRLEDQKHINTFGRLNGRLHDLEDDLKTKQAEHELLDDAANEIILADDDEPVRCAPSRPAVDSPTAACTAKSVRALLALAAAHRRSARRRVHVPGRYAFGECYYEVTKDAADELLESQKEKVAGEMSKLEEELTSVRATLADLKSKLYARFGKSINLEE